MSQALRIPSVTPVIGYIICLQLLFTPAYTKDFILNETRTTILAQIGEELNITCLGTKCDKPVFTWSTLSDMRLGGTTERTGQISVLNMKISSQELETYGSYRCTVTCDNPPAEKGFKVVVYSFPEPVLSVSSRVAGERSRISCTIPDAYPFHKFTARLFIGQEVVANNTDQDLYVDAVNDIVLSHDVVLTNTHDAQEIKCEVELEFDEDDDILPMYRNSSLQLNLLYPPEKPSIEVYPDPNVRAAENITLSCSFQSSATAHWLKLDNGAELVMKSDRGTLTIENASPEDSGLYICRVQNDVGQSSSQVQITVQARQAPTLRISPAASVRIGQPVTIECIPNGNENVMLWKIKEDDVPVLVDLKITIDRVLPEDRAVYACSVGNQYRAGQASEESLTVEYSPMGTIFASSDEDVIEGGEINLTCTSEGVPEPIYSLYHLLPSGDGVLLSEGPTVTLTNVTSGVYQCKASNSLGSEEKTLELRVRSPPKHTSLTITPSVMVKLGESVHISCTSDAYPAPEIMLSKKTRTGLIRLSAENGQYSITHVTEDDSGVYMCSSSNVLGEREVDISLIVQVPPRNTVLTINPSPMLKEGEGAHVRCTSEGFPGPQLVLKRQKAGEVHEIEAENGEYWISHVGVEHDGTYICESINAAGQDRDENMLTVQVPPKNTAISITPSSAVREGDEVQILCISEAYPSPRLVLMMKTEHGLISQLESEDGLYNITNVGENNAGMYICESANVVGQQTANIILTVQIPSRNVIVVTPSQNITSGANDTFPNEIHEIPPPERQQSPRFDYVPPAIIGSVVLATAGFMGMFAHRLKQMKLQGSYSLVNALNSKV